MKKRIRLLFTIMLSFIFISTSFGFYQDGDTTNEGTIVDNQTSAEMNDNLTKAGCDDMNAMNDAISKMTDPKDIEAYLAEQAAIYSKATGCVIEMVWNNNGNAISSNTPETNKVSEIDTDIKEALTKSVAEINDEHYVFLGIYNKGALNTEEEEEEEVHVCTPWSSSWWSPGCIHSHPNEGTPAVSRPDSAFTSSISPSTSSTLNNPLIIGDSFDLTGNTHILRSYSQQVAHPVGICPNIQFTQSCQCTECSPTIHETITDSCGYVYTWIRYLTPIYFDTYHDISISFVGFKAEGKTSIKGNLISSFATAPAVNEKPYKSSFKVTEFTNDLKFDSDTGLSIGKAIVKCSCGKTYTHNIYFNLTPPPPPSSELYKLNIRSEDINKGAISINNSPFSQLQSEKLKIGTERYIKAKPADGYKFIGWYEADGKLYSTNSGANDKLKVIQPGYDYTLTAKFDEKPKYTVTVKSNGNGLVGINDNETTKDNLELSVTVTEGTLLNIKSTPDTNCEFLAWKRTVDGTEINFKTDDRDEDFNLVVDSDYILTAYFSSDNDKILTVTNDGNGTTTGSTDHATPGNKYPITATPNPGFEFDRWEDENGITDLAQNDNVLMPENNYTITAYFVVDSNRSNLKAISNGNGSVYINDNPPAQEDIIRADNNTTHKIHALADENYEFDYWTDNSGKVISKEKDYEILLTKDVTYTAYFRPISETYKLEVKTDGNGTVTGSVDEALPNKSYEITATPNEGFEFDYWERNINGEKIPTDLAQNDNFTMPEEDVTLVARFRPLPPPPVTFNLEVLSNGNGYVIGGTPYAIPNNNYPIEAIPDEGYVFDYWEKIIDNQSTRTQLPQKTDFTMPTSDVTLIAHFKKDDGIYSLTVESAGNGSVTGSVEKALPNTSYEITATPDNGYKFSYWEKVTNTESAPTELKQNDYFIMPNEDIKLIAHFELINPSITYKLEVKTDGNGTVTGSVDEALPNKPYPITATPNENFEFDYWERNINGEKIPTELAQNDNFTMPKEDVTLVARFRPLPPPPVTFNLEVLSNGNGYVIGGTPYAIPDNNYPIEARPDKGYVFDYWEKIINNQSTETQLPQKTDFTMPTSDVTLIAHFKLDDGIYKLTVESDGNGSVTGGVKEAIPNTTYEITATPDNNYHFSYWEMKTVDGSEKTKLPANANFTMINKDVTLIAHFKKDNPNGTFVLKVKSNGNGSVTGGTNYATPGKHYDISATPDTNYVFDYWEMQTNGINEKTDLASNVSFKMPDTNVTLIAHFIEDNNTIDPTGNEYDLIIETTPGGTATGSGTYPEGEEVIVKATPSRGYTFGGWYDENDKILSLNTTTIIIMPAHDYTITPIFIPIDYNNNTNSAFIVKSIRDLRWQNYFAGGNSYSYKKLCVPYQSTNSTVLVNEIDLEDTSYDSYRNIVYGYAVETELQTAGIELAHNPKLQINYTLIDKNTGNPINNKLVDADKFLSLTIDPNNVNNDFMTSTKISYGTNNGQTYTIITWNWMFYLPTNIKTISGNYLWEEYEEIIVDYDIHINLSGSGIKFDYITAINRIMENNDWGGRVFTYRSTDNKGKPLTVLTDLQNGLSH